MANSQIIEEDEVVEFFSRPKTLEAKELVASSLKMDMPLYLQTDLKHTSTAHTFPIIRIIFRGFLVKEALISKASRQFHVDISILQSNIEFIAHRPVGFLLAQVRGSSETIDKTLAFFGENQLEWEIMGYAA
jgi:D-methionine transport system ATP-binding protein